jgi:hypothetical protein
MIPHCGIMPKICHGRRSQPPPLSSQIFHCHFSKIKPGESALNGTAHAWGRIYQNDHNHGGESNEARQYAQNSLSQCFL